MLYVWLLGGGGASTRVVWVAAFEREKNENQKTSDFQPGKKESRRTFSDMTGIISRVQVAYATPFFH